MTKPTLRSKEKKEASHDFVSLLVAEFRAKYPDLNLNSLSPALPERLEDVRLTQKAFANINLHPVVLSVICGTTLFNGDSNLAIQKNYKNARLTYRHSTRQSDWFMWKSLFVFNDFASEQAIQFQLPDGHQAEAARADGECLGKLKMATNVTSELTKLQGIIAPKNVKTIERHWLNHMNNYFLMTMWLDDGGLTGDLGRQGVIATGEMPLAQVQLLANYLTTVWGIRCEACELTSANLMVKTQTFPTRITIKDQENLQKFLRIIAPIIPVKSMLYKICFFPADVPLQQRWASELKTMVRDDWHSTIDKIYLYKTLSFLYNYNKAKKQIDTKKIE